MRHTVRVSPPLLMRVTSEPIAMFLEMQETFCARLAAVDFSLPEGVGIAVCAP